MQRLKWFAFGAITSMVVLLIVFPRARPTLIPYYNYLRMAAFTALGRNPLCSAEDASAGRDMVLRWENVVDAEKRTTRLLETAKDGTTLWDTSSGKWWMPEGANRDFLASLVSEQSVGIYVHSNASVRQGDVVLDCGANIGVFTREALRRGAAKVIAIEPGPANIAALRKNLAQEIKDGRVVIYEKGVWDRDQDLVLEIVEKNPGANSVCRSAGGCVGPTIRLTTIDKLVAELGLAHVDFIKMDIEGAERQALAGGSATLKKDKPRLAVATEHLEVSENTSTIAQLIPQLQPSYQRNCGRCESGPDGAVVPDILFFH